MLSFCLALQRLHIFFVMGSDLSANFSSEAQNKINLFG